MEFIPVLMPTRPSLISRMINRLLKSCQWLTSILKVSPLFQYFYFVKNCILILATSLNKRLAIKKQVSSDLARSYSGRVHGTRSLQDCFLLRLACSGFALRYLVGAVSITTEIAITDRNVFLFLFSKVVINLSLASIAFRAISTLANLILVGSYGTVGIDFHFLYCLFVRLFVSSFVCSFACQFLCPSAHLFILFNFSSTHI